MIKKCDIICIQCKKLTLKKINQKEIGDIMEMESSIFLSKIIMYCIIIIAFAFALIICNTGSNYIMLKSKSNKKNDKLKATILYSSGVVLFFICLYLLSLVLNDRYLFWFVIDLIIFVIILTIRKLIFKSIRRK